MIGFELQTSGIGSDWSTNWATATAIQCKLYGIKNFLAFWLVDKFEKLILMVEK